VLTEKRVLPSQFGHIVTLISQRRQMKRTITEIIVEVEETLLVRHTEKTADSTEASPTKETLICPNCGQAIYKSEDSENLKTGEKI
jgi:hypothetical protein